MVQVGLLPSFRSTSKEEFPGRDTRVVQVVIRRPVSNQYTGVEFPRPPETCLDRVVEWVSWSHCRPRTVHLHKCFYSFSFIPTRKYLMFEVPEGISYRKCIRFKEEKR